MARMLLLFLFVLVVAAPALAAPKSSTLTHKASASKSDESREVLPEAERATKERTRRARQGLADRPVLARRLSTISEGAAPQTQERGEAEEGQAEAAQAPPSRAGAFAGGYMAATGLSTLWVVNQVVWWGLVALSVLAPPLAPLAAGGLCTTSAVVCGMPVVQGLLVARLGDAMGGFDSLLAYLVAIGAAYTSALLIGGGAVLAAVLLSQAITPWVGAPTTTRNGTTTLDPLPFAAHAGVALGLAAGAFLVQPLVPAALFAVSATTPGPLRQAWKDRRDHESGDSDDEERFDNEELYDDDDESYEVRFAPVKGPRLAAVQRF